MTTINAAALATKIYRALNQTSRIEGPIKYVRNGGSTKQYGCALCGACSPTWCGRYRVTVRVLDWCDDHSASGCYERYVAAHPRTVAKLGYTQVGEGRWIKGDVEIGALASAYYPQAVGS